MIAPLAWFIVYYPIPYHYPSSSIVQCSASVQNLYIFYLYQPMPSQYKYNSVANWYTWHFCLYVTELFCIRPKVYSSWKKVIMSLVLSWYSGPYRLQQLPTIFPVFWVAWPFSHNLQLHLNLTLLHHQARNIICRYQQWNTSANL